MSNINSTENFPDKDIILKELEKHGGICDCQSSRDTFIYAASADSRGIEPVTKLLADVTLRPKLTEEEVHVARQVVNFELESLGMRLCEMCDVITRELVTMATSPGVQELRRAKTQLQSMLLMNLEARPVVFEDIGRQVLAIGSRKRPEYFIQEIEKITAEDIQRIAKRILSSPPAVAARGEIRGLPDLKDIQTALMHSDGRLPSNKRLSLFR